MLKEHEPQLVHYTVGNVDEELILPQANYVEWRLVIVAHDKMTVQANDRNGKDWVFEDEY